MSRWLSLLVGLILFSPSAHADPAIPPGHEADIMGLFAPYQDEGVVVGTVILAGVQIGAREVVVTLRDPGPPVAQAKVRLRLQAGPRSFSVHIEKTEHAALHKAQQAIAKAVARNDDGKLSPKLPTTDKSSGIQGLSAPKRLWQTPEAWLASLLWLLLLAALGHPLWRALTLAVRSPKRALL
ncbi:MAG: hypothetical protein KC502_23570, partial [Myxococcales bacterium]|nr:hypothetical protein [Myxococcales bacterium]